MTVERVRARALSTATCSTERIDAISFLPDSCPMMADNWLIRHPTKLSYATYMQLYVMLMPPSRGNVNKMSNLLRVEMLLVDHRPEKRERHRRS